MDMTGVSSKKDSSFLKCLGHSDIDSVEEVFKSRIITEVDIKNVSTCMATTN
jgi:hypothetical protein